MKAFLSHSSQDEEFVRAVAKELGRQFCVFDEQAFSTGDEFKASIEHGLDDSSVFVLFASKAALESVWVTFETEEAWYGRLRGKLTKSLVYLIDSSVAPEDLPDWLGRAMVRRENAAKLIAREIRAHLDQLLRERQQSYFVGRHQEIETLERAVSPVDGSAAPRAFFVTGLPGIGRRSLVQHTAPCLLGLRRHLQVYIGEGDLINDVCVKLANHTEPYSTQEGFQRLVAAIQALSPEEALERTMVNLRRLTSSGDLPIFFDEGGLLDNEGYITHTIRAIVGELAPNDEAYIAFISTRRPQATPGVDIPVVQLPALNDDDTKRLLATLANHLAMSLSGPQVAELAEYIAGYPPAAHYAMQQARNYGIELVMRDKSALVPDQAWFFRKNPNKGSKCPF